MVARSLAPPGIVSRSASAAMLEFLSTPTAQVVLGLSALTVMVVVAVFVIGKVRPGSAEPTITTSDLLTNFRELHAKGELTDAEFRTIKSKLTERLQRELSVPENEG